MAGPGTREVQNLRHQRSRGRGMGAVHASTPGAGTSRVTPASPQGSLEKRARHEEGGGDRSKEKELIIIEEEQEGGGVERPTDGEEGSWVHPRELPWALEFRHYAGRVISHADSVKNLSLAYGMLQGYILPRDAQAIDGLTEDLTTEIPEDFELRALPEAPLEELVLPGEEDEEMQNAEVDPNALVLGHNTEATVAASEGHADPNASAPN
ncbi:hypothetical protein RHMOL_Rhmol06G0003100 [Rhododendron molle]|uniref:Uncharacterized protein n=1 Tax=Rhododendron molle TaxID=49168 RepID=A0ACC0N815_RHOML|nr:hypothetical protein RHMOL_Rhmol06G0003100 [Rhododendron molle]